MSKPTPDATVSQQIGQALQQTRLRSGITQAELGKALGVQRVTVSRWERGERSLDLTTLLTIARLLRINPEALLPGDRVTHYEQREHTAPQRSLAASPPADPPAVAQAIRLLRRHPELAVSVIELIETMCDVDE